MPDSTVTTALGAAAGAIASGRLSQRNEEVLAGQVEERAESIAALAMDAVSFVCPSEAAGAAAPCRQDDNESLHHWEGSLYSAPAATAVVSPSGDEPVRQLLDGASELRRPGHAAPPSRWVKGPDGKWGERTTVQGRVADVPRAVSYTHLTLPTT